MSSKCKSSSSLLSFFTLEITFLHFFPYNRIASSAYLYTLTNKSEIMKLTTGRTSNRWLQGFCADAESRSCKVGRSVFLFRNQAEDACHVKILLAVMKWRRTNKCKHLIKVTSITEKIFSLSWHWGGLIFDCNFNKYKRLLSSWFVYNRLEC